MSWGLPWWLSGTESAYPTAGDVGSIPRLGRSPRGGNGNPLQYSCLENPMGRGVCWASVSSVQFSCSVVSDSLWPHGLQHARLPCPSLSPRVCSDSCPLSRWCYLTISTSASPFSFIFSLSQHQGLFQWVSSSHQVAKYWSFSFSISSSSEYSQLISFRIDWFDLPAVQGTLKSLLQHHTSKASLLWCSAFFIVQLSCPTPYMTTRKTIALTRRTFVGKVTSLCFNMLSRFVIAFLPRSKCLFFFFF